MPSHVLLAAKLIAVFLLAHRAESYGSSYALALGPLSLAWAIALGLLERAVALVAAVLLLCNCGVRWMCVALGLAVTFQFALHRVDHGELFLAVFLLGAALQRNGCEPMVLRYCVVLFHLASGVIWLFGPGSAPLFDVLAVRERADNIVPSENLVALEAALPPGMLPRLTDWAMAVVSFGLAAGFLIPRFYSAAIWAALLLYCAWGLLAVPAGVISYAMLAPYLVFAVWPREALTVIYDGDCGFCNKTREWISSVDFDRLYRWAPFQSGVGAKYGIPQKALEEKVHVVAVERIYTGFRAFRIMALYNPATMLSAAIVLAAIGLGAPAIRDWLFAALLLLFSPLFYPLGEAAYGWVARNRHRLPPRSCKVPE